MRWWNFWRIWGADRITFNIHFSEGTSTAAVRREGRVDSVRTTKDGKGERPGRSRAGSGYRSLSKKNENDRPRQCQAQRKGPLFAYFFWALRKSMGGVRGAAPAIFSRVQGRSPAVLIFYLLFRRQPAPPLCEEKAGWTVCEPPRMIKGNGQPGARRIRLPQSVEKERNGPSQTMPSAAERPSFCLLFLGPQKKYGRGAGRSARDLQPGPGAQPRSLQPAVLI